MESFSGKRVLVTGGSGFIGSHLTRRLVAEGARVAVLTKYHSSIDNIRIVDVWNQLEVIEADIRNQDSLQKIRRFKPDIVYHLAAYNHVGDSFVHVQEALQCNMVGTANVFEACDNFERFVYVATSEVYGHQRSVPFSEELSPFPISPYAVGKYGGEMYCRMKMHSTAQDVVVLRPFNAFGPYQSTRAIIAEIILTCLQGKEVHATQGAQTRDFNYVQNLVDGFLLAGIRNEASGQIINLGSGTEISIKDLILEIHRQTNSSSELHFGSLSDRPTEIWRMVASNDTAKDILGWSPIIDFAEGMRRTIEWYRNYVDVFEGEASGLQRLSRQCATP